MENKQIDIAMLFPTNVLDGLEEVGAFVLAADLKKRACVCMPSWVQVNKDTLTRVDGKLSDDYSTLDLSCDSGIRVYFSDKTIHEMDGLDAQLELAKEAVAVPKTEAPFAAVVGRKNGRMAMLSPERVLALVDKGILFSRTESGRGIVNKNTDLPEDPVLLYQAVFRDTCLWKGKDFATTLPLTDDGEEQE